MQILNREFNGVIFAFFGMTGCLVLPEGVGDRTSYLINELNNHGHKHIYTVYSPTLELLKSLAVIGRFSRPTDAVQTDLRRYGLQ